MGLLIPDPSDEPREELLTVAVLEQVARRYNMEICQGGAGGLMVRLVA